MSRIKKTSLLVIIILMTVTSCGRSTVSEQEQQFTFISVYEGMSKYVEAARSDPGVDLNELFQKYIIDVYWKECAGGGEYVFLGEDAFKDPIKDLDGLEEEITLLRSSGIEDIVEEALKHASAMLDGPDTTVCIATLNPENTFVREYMNGVTGRTVGSGKILAQVSIQDDWQNWVAYLIAHEYHHSVWTSLHYERNEGNDLLNYLVFEGRADSFARLVYPDIEAPWIDALTPEQEAQQWRKMESQLSITDYGIKQRYMFGDGRSVPLWSGYTIGFHIVQSYLRQSPETTLSEWTAMDAWEILEQSGYSGEP
jgi:uncharacterized protein YjaZ